MAESYFVDIDTIKEEADRLHLTNKEFDYAAMLLRECAKFEELGLDPRVIYNPNTGKYSVSSYESFWGMYH